MGMLNQILCTLIASFLSFVLGVSYAWPSSTMQLFKSANTPLERPMVLTEIALLSSLSSIGALIGTPPIGIFLDIIGRKYCAIAAGLMSVLAWTMIATCVKVEAILAAIFVSGVGGAVILVVPVFVGEICQESIRGNMTSFSMIFFGIGMLASYLLGGLLEYNMMVYICLSLTVLGVIMLLFLKETPMYLMKRGMDKEAQQSFAFYRNAAFDSKIVLYEMEKLRRAFNPVLEDDEVPSKSVDDNSVHIEEYFLPNTLILETLTAEELRLDTVEQQMPEKVSFIRFIKKSRSTRRAIMVTLVLVIASVFQGLVSIQVYADMFFTEVVPSMSATLCSVLLAVTGILAGFVGAYLTDVCGRRPLMIYASLASGISCIILGTQIHLKWGPEWVTAMMVYIYTTMYTLGAGTVPLVFVVEVFLPEIKGLITMVAVELVWLCNFIILFTFEPLVSYIGIGPVFYLFAGIGILSAIYSTFYQPETKGIAVDEIQNAFMKSPLKETEEVDRQPLE